MVRSAPASDNMVVRAYYSTQLFLRSHILNKFEVAYPQQITQNVLNYSSAGTGADADGANASAARRRAPRISLARDETTSVALRSDKRTSPAPRCDRSRPDIPCTKTTASVRKASDEADDDAAQSDARCCANISTGYNRRFRNF